MCYGTDICSSLIQSFFFQRSAIFNVVQYVYHLQVAYILYPQHHSCVTHPDIWPSKTIGETALITMATTVQVIISPPDVFLGYFNHSCFMDTVHIKEAYSYAYLI